MNWRTGKQILTADTGESWFETVLEPIAIKSGEIYEAFAEVEA